ncbi:MAG: hypothetical protein J0I41_13355 [Filimonas sp.]|nr:hypothetical protein [Filimonas sp.]
MEIDKISEVLKHLVQLLLAEDYERIYEADIEKRLTVEMIKEGIDEYAEDFGGPLSEFDEDGYENAKSMFPILNGTKMVVNFYLWFDEEESDLTLSLELVKNAEGKYEFAITNLYIM